MRRNSLAQLMAIALGLVIATPSLAQTSQPLSLDEGLDLAPGFEEITLDGHSGGSSSSQDCGYTATAANHEITLRQDFSYLRLEVEAEGSPTLLVIGPDSGDRFCARSLPQQSGYWQAGTYRIYVGDRNGSSQPYRLLISENP
ncbi:hypothetical protein E1H12_06455 [Geitlerinema sp. P-1104]|uniref:hypothetical protein n=1 Tax=Geitlerinema sp. P-1104 TaxID=2546230 RepID=UPI001477880B|nr:hypothetical protein [Geitlerinema sp. P-1104]NMG58174.1 hypothetical protein [Geitlerinema sp. P-1104]